MDYATIFSEHFVAVVVLACLVLGYIIKTSLNFIPNKYIPTILAVVGAVTNCAVSGISIESVVYGSFMGLISTGLYEMFRQYIEKGKVE